MWWATRGQVDIIIDDIKLLKKEVFGRSSITSSLLTANNVLELEVRMANIERDVKLLIDHLKVKVNCKPRIEPIEED